MNTSGIDPDWNAIHSALNAPPPPLRRHDFFDTLGRWCRSPRATAVRVAQEASWAQAVIVVSLAVVGWIFAGGVLHPAVGLRETASLLQRSLAKGVVFWSLAALGGHMVAAIIGRRGNILSFIAVVGWLFVFSWADVPLALLKGMSGAAAVPVFLLRLACRGAQLYLFLLMWTRVYAEKVAPTEPPRAPSAPSV